MQGSDGQLHCLSKEHSRETKNTGDINPLLYISHCWQLSVPVISHPGLLGYILSSAKFVFVRLTVLLQSSNSAGHIFIFLPCLHEVQHFFMLAVSNCKHCVIHKRHVCHASNAFSDESATKRLKVHISHSSDLVPSSGGIPSTIWYN